VEGGQHGFDTAYHFDSTSARSDSELALQQELGLWTKRGYWSDSGDRDNPAIAESSLETIGTIRPTIASPGLNRQRTNARIT
jgi:hypothetical protein